MGAIKTLKEHRQSINYGKPKSNPSILKNRLPRFKNSKAHVLSLSFKEEMEQDEQHISNEIWDEIFLLFTKYLNKITPKEYIKVHNQVKI